MPHVPGHPPEEADQSWDTEREAKDDVAVLKEGGNKNARYELNTATGKWDVYIGVIEKGEDRIRIVTSEDSKRKWDHIEIALDNGQYATYLRPIAPGAQSIKVDMDKSDQVGNVYIYRNAAGDEILRERVIPDAPNSGTKEEINQAIRDSGTRPGTWVAKWNPSLVDANSKGSGWEAVLVEDDTGITTEPVEGTDQVMVFYNGKPMWRASVSGDDPTLPPLSSMEVEPVEGTDQVIVRLGNEQWIASKGKDPIKGQFVTFPEAPGRQWLKFGNQLIDVTPPEARTPFILERDLNN